MTTLDRFLKPGVRKWAPVVIADACAVGVYFLWDPLRWAAIALGASAVAIYLVWVIVPKPKVRRWAPDVVALAVFATGIYFLWGPARWAAVAVSPVASAVAINLLLGIVRKPDFLNWAAVVVALGVCAVGIYLLWGVWDGKPAAAAFTRVGGATRVETALEASRFWLTPPQLVVETQTEASSLMLGAAKCAMAHDAPLLFTSSDPARQRLVDATIDDWRAIETTRPESIIVRSRVTFDGRSETLPATFQNLPEVIPIRNQPDVSRCLANGDPADVAGLSTLEIPSPIIRLPSQVPPRQTLAPVVVFAAAIEPGDPPDVAIGLALAAHMARANEGKVSLVVVPHYLESDPALEHKLQSQHEQVTGGVVLGETPTVPEDTRVLLRQLLTSTDRQGVAAQLQANLGSVGSLITALLALAAVATVGGIAAPIVAEHRKRAEHKRHVEERTGTGPPPPTPIFGQAEEYVEKIAKDIAKQAEEYLDKVRVMVMRGEKNSAWLDGLGDKREVTVCLRSGRKVSGIIVAQFPTDTHDATAFRIQKATLTANAMDPSQAASQPGPGENDVLVSVKDIELIILNNPKSEDTNANQTQGAAAGS